MLDEIIGWLGKPKAIRYDNSFEFINHVFEAGRGVTASELCIFNWANRNRTRMWSVTTAYAARVAGDERERLRVCKWRLHGGYGLKATHALTWCSGCITLVIKLKEEAN